MLHADSEKECKNPLDERRVVPSWLRGPLAHRAYLCALSLTLLWTTTLKVAIGIVGIFFNTPPFSAVHSTCEAAYVEVLSQRDKYGDCVERELSVCDQELNEAYESEKQRSNDVLESNAKKLDLIGGQVTACGTTVEATGASLQQWSVAGGSNTISYSYGPQCTADQMSLLKARVKDAHEIKSEGMAGLRQYISDTEDTLNSVAAYSEGLSAYNKQYIQNHTGGLVSSSYRVKLDGDMAVASAISKVKAEMNALVLSTEQLIICLGLSNSTTSTERKKCVSGRGVYDIYTEIVSFVELEKRTFLRDIDEYKNVLNDYVGKVEGAIAAADNFYDAINGGRGLMRYLVKDLSLFGSSAELCGKTTPNWCSFSKVIISF